MDTVRSYKTPVCQRLAFQRWYAKMTTDPEWREAENERLRIWRDANRDRYREIMRNAAKRAYDRKKAARSTEDGLDDESSTL